MRKIDKQKTVYHKTCVGCGVAFDTNKMDQKFCGWECFRKNFPKRKRIPRAVPPTTKTFTEIIKEIEQHNKENGTRLSYGQWVMMGGKLTK